LVLSFEVISCKRAPKYKKKDSCTLPSSVLWAFLRAFDHICIEMARYKFLIVIVNYFLFIFLLMVRIFKPKIN